MNYCILGAVKKLLGVAEEDTFFDPDVMAAVNSAIGALTQLGVGPAEGFAVRDGTETWEMLLGDGANLESVKSYIHLKAKLVFDPPQAGPIVESINKVIGELEWRILATMEGRR